GASGCPVALHDALPICDQVRRRGVESGDPAQVVHLRPFEVVGAVDRGIGSVALDDAELPLLLEDHADVLDRGPGIGVVDGEVVDVVLVDARVFSAERVVHTAGAAGAEGQIGDEIAVTASGPAPAAIAVSPAAVTAGSEDAEPQDRSAQGGKTPSSHSHGFSSLSTRA